MRPPAPAAPPVPEGPLRVDAVVPAPDGSAWRIRAGGSVLGRVDLDVPAELGLTPGRVLDRAAADGLRAALLRRAAYEAGLRLLGRRPQTKAALRARLRARFGEEAAARAEERLAAHLDDGAFAAAWIEERLRLRPLGAAALQAGLCRAGVPRSVAAAAVAAAAAGDAGAERARCLALGRRRVGRLAALPPARAAARLAGFLSRRGFRGEDVRFTLRTLGLPDRGEHP